MLRWLKKVERWLGPTTTNSVGKTLDWDIPYSTYYKPMGDLPYISSEQEVGL